MKNQPGKDDLVIHIPDCKYINDDDNALQAIGMVTRLLADNWAASLCTIDECNALYNEFADLLIRIYDPVRSCGDCDPGHD